MCIRDRSGILLGFIVPLIIWLTNKDKTDKAWLNSQAMEALNFQITLAIAYVAVSYTHLDVYKRQPLNLGEVALGASLDTQTATALRRAESVQQLSLIHI